MAENFLDHVGLAPLDERNDLHLGTTLGTAKRIRFVLPKATSLIYGQVKNQAGKPLAGVQVAANDSDLGFQTNATTDTNGNYTLGAVAGNWSGPTKFYRVQR
jgi:Carboxypeptidase regulatory-like domain